MADELVEGFKRQRRNLMGMSVVVFFTQYVGLQFDTVNVFGNKATISEPDKVHYFLWALLGYWLIRYTQYLHEIGFPNGWSDFFSKRGHLVLERESELREAGKQDAVQSYLGKKLSQDTSELHSYPHGSDIEEIYINLVIIGTGQSLNYMELRCNYEFYEDRSPYHFDEETELGFKKLLAPNIKAFTYVILRKRFFSEYLLPFFLFLVPVGYKFMS